MIKLKKIMTITMLIFCMIILYGCGKDIAYPEITVTESDLENKFHYNLIENEANRLVYKELYEGFSNQSDEIYLHGDENTPVWTLVEFVIYDNPEIFWCDADTKMTYELHDFWGENYIVLYPKYAYSKGDVSVMKQELETMTFECIETCMKKKSDYEKVKYVYEYIIDSVEYMDDAPDNQNIYSALVSGKSVCAGYAKGVQYLLEQAGVVCNTVSGKSLDENDKYSGHAWNIVKCDDEYYYVDATWGDYKDKNEKKTEGSLKLKNYDYLCCSDVQLEKTHKANHEEKMPECSSEKLNYYRKNGMYYEKFEEREILEAMQDSIASKEEYITLKFQNEEDFIQAMEVLETDLLDDALQYLAGYYELEKANCTYDYYEDLWKINVYWQYE